MDKNEFDLEQEKNKVELKILCDKQKKLKEKFDFELQAYSKIRKAYDSNKGWSRGRELARLEIREKNNSTVFVIFGSGLFSTFVGVILLRYFAMSNEWVRSFAFTIMLFLFIFLTNATSVFLFALIDRYNPQRLNMLLPKEMEKYLNKMDSIKKELYDIDKRMAEINEILAGGE